MKDKLIDRINAYTQRYSFDDSAEEEITATALANLQGYLSPEANEVSYNQKEIIKAIKSYFEQSEIQRNKLLSYCEKFYDPTECRSISYANGEEVQLNAFLQEDDLYKLYQFVKRHESDSTFGATVYKVMDKHKLTPPKVYKAALLRRQDFSRVTDSKCKSVTKLLAWQIIIGLHCNMEEADEVLFSAGYIRRKNKFDLIMQYFIEHKNYDVMAINEVLDKLNLKAFSCYKSVRDSDTQ